MSGRHFALDTQQPESFVFSASSEERVTEFLARYPEGRQASAVLPLLDLAQRQHGGWLPKAAIRHVASRLDMPEIRVLEVATFYTMFNLAPVGDYLIQLCRTTPCWLRGSDGIREACLNHLGIGLGETTSDGKFTVIEVECLGACVNAPMVQINDDFYEDLTPERMVTVLNQLAAGKTLSIGSQDPARRTSEPVGAQTTLVGAGEGA